jgi:hypothetical protein
MTPSAADRLRLPAEVLADSAARLWSQLLGLPPGEVDPHLLHLGQCAANAARLLFQELARRAKEDKAR